MKVERCKCLISESEFYEIQKRLRGLSPQEISFKRNILNFNNEIIGTFVLKSYNENKCKGAFYIYKNIKASYIRKPIKIDIINNMYGIHLIKVNDINYCINIDIDKPINRKDIIRKFDIYVWNLDHNIMNLWSLIQYTDLLNDIERSILLFCLVHSIVSIKSNKELMHYIEKKFEYYGYNILNKKSVTKINFKKKLNSNYFEFINDKKYTAEWYYNMFYDLFRYLWNLNSPIDLNKYYEIGFYSTIDNMFREYIEIMKI